MCVSLLLHAGALYTISTVSDRREAVYYSRPLPALSTTISMYHLQPGPEKQVPIKPEPGSSGPGFSVPGFSEPGFSKQVPSEPATSDGAGGRRDPVAEQAETESGTTEDTDNIRGKPDDVVYSSGIVSAKNPDRTTGGAVPIRGSAGKVSSGTGFSFLSVSHVRRMLIELIEDRKRYPDNARRRGIEGTVELMLTVEADGSLKQCLLTKPSGSRILDRDASRLVKSIFPLDAALERKLSTSVRINYSLQ